MEMEIKEGTFWLLRNPDPKGNIVLFDNIDDAIKSVKEMLRNDISSEDIDLMAMHVTGENITGTGVTWSEIATKLVKL